MSYTGLAASPRDLGLKRSGKISVLFDEPIMICALIGMTSSYFWGICPVRSRCSKYAILLCFAGVMMLASASRAQEITFEEHIRPIFREHCAACHNAQKESSGLALDSYARVIQGGAGGEVVYSGDLGSSRLWSLVNHDEQPVMPPNQDPIAAEKRALIKQWIEQGLRERSGSAPVAAAGGGLAAVVTDSDDNSPGVVPLETCLQPVAVAERAAAVASVAVSPKAPLVAVAGQHQVLIFHTDSSELVTIIPFLEGSITSLRFSRDSRILMVAGGQAAKSGCCVLYDVATGRKLAKLGDELDTVLAADMDRGLKTLALGSSNKLVRGIDISTAAPKYEIKKHTDWVTALDMSPDGAFMATGDRQGGLVVWEVAAGREYQVLEGHGLAVTSICWRGDSKIFATSSEDGTIRLWDREKVKAERSWDAHPGGALQVRFGKNGNLVSIGRDKTPKMWNTDAANLATFTALRDVGLTVDLSFDGKHVIAGDWSGQVKVFTTEPPAERCELNPNPPKLEDQLLANEQALAAAQSDLEARRSLLAQATATRDAGQVEFDAAVNKYRTTKAEVESARQQSVAAGQPADLSSREAEVVELERMVGRLAAARLLSDEALAEAQRNAQSSEASFAAFKAKHEALTAAFANFQQIPQKLVERINAAQQSIVLQEQTIAKEDALLAAIDELTGIAAKTLEQFKASHSEEMKSAEGAPQPTSITAGIEEVRDRVASSREIQVQACTTARETLQSLKQSSESLRLDFEFFQQAYPSP
jgi:WD40 repeat protein